MRTLSRMMVAMLAVLVAAGCNEETSPAAANHESARNWTPVAEWSGRGSRQTETFTMLRHEWRLRWAARPAAGASGAPTLQVTVHSADSGRILAAPVDHHGDGDGVVEVVEEPRQFYLTVESAGVDWVLQVEESGRAGP